MGHSLLTLEIWSYLPNLIPSLRLRILNFTSSLILFRIRMYEARTRTSLLWNFSFIWNHPVCLLVLKLALLYKPRMRSIPNGKQLFRLLFSKGRLRNVERFFKAHVQNHYPYYLLWKSKVVDSMIWYWQVDMCSNQSDVKSNAKINGQNYRFYSIIHETTLMIASPF